MNTITMARPAVAGATVGWDHLEQTVDHLADVVDHLARAPEFLCSLRFAEAEALAEVLDAGHHTDTAARLMHRWALTEPDWDDDAEQSAVLREWLALSVSADAR